MNHAHSRTSRRGYLSPMAGIGVLLVLVLVMLQQAESALAANDVAFVTNNQSLSDLETQMSGYDLSLKKAGKLPVALYTDDLGLPMEYLAYAIGVVRGSLERPAFPKDLDGLLCNLNPRVCKRDAQGVPTWSNRKGDELCIPAVHWADAVRFVRVKTPSGDHPLTQLDQSYGVCTIYGKKCAEATANFLRTRDPDGTMESVVLSEAANKAPTSHTACEGAAQPVSDAVTNVGWRYLTHFHAFAPTGAIKSGSSASNGPLVALSEPLVPSINRHLLSPEFEFKADSVVAAEESVTLESASTIGPNEHRDCARPEGGVTPQSSEVCEAWRDTRAREATVASADETPSRIVQRNADVEQDAMFQRTGKEEIQTAASNAPPVATVAPPPAPPPPPPAAAAAAAAPMAPVIQLTNIVSDALTRSHFTQRSFTGRTIGVFVFDSAINDCHVVLRDAISSHPKLCPPFVATQPSFAILDAPNDSDHGTHVAGLIAGKYGVGIDPQATVIPITILSSGVVRMTFDRVQRDQHRARDCAPGYAGRQFLDRFEARAGDDHIFVEPAYRCT